MSCHPWDSNAKNKTNQIPHDKTLLFLVCLASKLRGNQIQAQVAPDGRRTHSASPPNPMSHLFLALVHPPNHMRTFQLVSLRWLQCNPRRNLLLILLHPLHNHHQQYAHWIPPPLPPSATPLLSPLVPPPSTSTPEIPPIAAKNPNTSSPRCPAHLIPTMDP
ncbi:hypothetical protein O181_132778 [Austropuccinia psidii MF-1]|uniref:Uncharacterized protein n=1 Tax=Austropuccinia psidii MF-1 TaxID=1389203 RepID=A0A9Q3L4G4_9BASI|nr:hypothetical protein [Austropuccinia psidii MF-1]